MVLVCCWVDSDSSISWKQLEASDHSFPLPLWWLLCTTSSSSLVGLKVSGGYWVRFKRVCALALDNQKVLYRHQLQFSKQGQLFHWDCSQSSLETPNNLFHGIFFWDLFLVPAPNLEKSGMYGPSPTTHTHTLSLRKDLYFCFQSCCPLEANLQTSNKLPTSKRVTNFNRNSQLCW